MQWIIHFEQFLKNPLKHQAYMLSTLWHYFYMTFFFFLAPWTLRRTVSIFQWPSHTLKGCWFFVFLPFFFSKRTWRVYHLSVKSLLWCSCLLLQVVSCAWPFRGLGHCGVHLRSEALSGLVKWSLWELGRQIEAISLVCGVLGQQNIHLWAIVICHEAILKVK